MILSGIIQIVTKSSHCTLSDAVLFFVHRKIRKNFDNLQIFSVKRCKDRQKKAEVPMKGTSAI